jgi:4-hydroxyphenylpyruvate dioxygenase
VLTGALRSESPVAAHQHHHGDGVKDIALSVPDVSTRSARGRAGAVAVVEPHERCDEHGAVKLAPIATYGETLHTFVERGGYAGPFLPGFEPSRTARRTAACCSRSTTSSATSSSAHGALGQVLRGRLRDDRDDPLLRRGHLDEYSALMSKVVPDGRGVVKFPINEPPRASASRRSTSTSSTTRAGAQHIAVSTRDIVGRSPRCAGAGRVPARSRRATTTTSRSRVPEVIEQLDDLRSRGILVDHDDEGYLLQIFTKPVGDRRRCSSR